MQEKLAEQIKEFDAMVKPAEEGGEIVYLGTPQNEDSVYKLLPDRGYTIRIWPSEFPDEKQISKYGDRLAPTVLNEVQSDASKVGHSIEPERFSDIDLAERKASYGGAGYALQFLLDTETVGL